MSNLNDPHVQEALRLMREHEQTDPDDFATREQLLDQAEAALERGTDSQQQ